PRVDQRLLAVMWLLAESWGRVTPAGTTLPLSLTHDALGALIGARRPTVTLALRELTERGAVIRQDQGWLLLEAPPHSTRPPGRVRDPAVLGAGRSTWVRGSDPVEPAEQSFETGADHYITVHETVATLREQHARNAARFRETVERVRRTRQRSRESRELLADQRLKRQLPRSS
ncbi:MAG TPA: helix-turn-helix domain-containing protein, partial [Solirubrobacteraceae bacterium]|nr:helix-turn-helix domain-containing protein [Solirubrobacteraceae bacterium]